MMQATIAMSYELKAHGVKTVGPVWDAIRKSPNSIYVNRDFRWYEVLSRLILDAVRDLSTKVEDYSIHEFSFEAHPPRGVVFKAYTAPIRDQIMEFARVQVTEGLTRSKTLAQLIPDSAKPFGALAVLDREGELELLASQPVTEISGLSGRRERPLAPWGIRTFLELANGDRCLVRHLETATGEAIWPRLRRSNST